MINVEMLLEQADFFRTMSSLIKERIAALCIVKQVREKELLFYEKEDGHSIYINGTALVQLYKTDEAGKGIVVRICHQGDLFGEVVLFERSVYPVNALVIKSGIILQIPRKPFLALLEDIQFRDSFIADLMRKQRYLAEKIAQLTVYDVEQRFFAFLHEHFGDRESVRTTLKKKHVADAIGSSAEAFSRTLQKLKKSGVCIWERDTITLQAGFWKSWFIG